MERIILITDHHQRVNNRFKLTNKNYTGDEECRAPWHTLIINQFGDAYNCHSPAWLPKSIGNILDYDDIFDLLNTHEAKSIRTEILQNRYTYCNSKLCNFFLSQPRATFTEIVQEPIQDTIPESAVHTMPTEIIFDFDYTCNFKCPSCRTELINNNNDVTMVKINTSIVNKIKKLIIDNCSEPTIIRWAGGEPFISRHYLELWEYIVKIKNKNIRNIIQTNGSYLGKKKKLLGEFLPFVDQIRISFDAGSKETYSRVRVNGVWEQLIDNVKLTKELITNKNTSTKLLTSFVVQQNNYLELPAYVKLARELKVDEIGIDHMWNWGTWSTEEFLIRNVSAPSHPEFKNFLKVLNSVLSNNEDANIRANYWDDALKNLKNEPT